jgi:hypothetical protein
MTAIADMAIICGMNNNQHAGISMLTLN